MEGRDQGGSFVIVLLFKALITISLLRRLDRSQYTCPRRMCMCMQKQNIK